MLDDVARSMAVIALIVTILRLKLLVKVTQNEYPSTIGFIAAISNDTLKLGDLTFNFGVGRHITCGIAGVRISKHIFDFRGVMVGVD